MTHSNRWRLCAQLVLRAVASNWFFRILLVVFVLQALYVALTGAYSMSYDEYFHLGIIKLYAQQWSPLLGHQPDGVATYGAVARDPSYFYHYLMSFPYRLFAHFVSNQSAQVIFLRLIDVTLFTTGIVVWRKVIRAAGLSNVATNGIILFFVLVPISSFVAGQLNYDNLLFLMTGVCLLLTGRVVNHMRTKRQLPARTTWLLLGCLAFSSIVKYAFLPILLAIALYLLATFWRMVGWRLSQLRPELRRLGRACRTWAGLGACLFFLAGLGLFLERYAVNTVQYHTPTPECDVVLDINTCRAYDPFGRNQKYKDADFKDLLQVNNKVTYPGTWFKGMLRSMYFSVGPKQIGYPAGNPLPVAYVTAWVLAIASLVVIVFRGRWLWRQNHMLQLFLVVSAVYVVVLFLQNLSDYLSLGVPVAVQGRYILPVLIPLIALAVVAASQPLRRIPLEWRVGLAIVVLLLTLDGGGVLPYAIRSADNWMWDTQPVLSVTRTVRSVLWPIVTR